MSSCCNQPKGARKGRILHLLAARRCLMCLFSIPGGISRLPKIGVVGEEYGEILGEDNV